jgi:hypothetical protein
VVATVAVLGLAAAAIAPTGASAWKYVFQDFFDVQGGGIGAAYAEAHKCHGGKLGYYKFRSSAGGYGGETELTIEIKADLPVFREFKPLKDVHINIEASPNFDENTINEIANAYGAFFDGIEAKWSPGELLFRHPDLIVFGTTILHEGKHLEDFKPKDKC